MINQTGSIASPPRDGFALKYKLGASFCALFKLFNMSQSTDNFLRRIRDGNGAGFPAGHPLRLKLNSGVSRRKKEA
jgi:hypothetical protein